MGNGSEKSYRKRIVLTIGSQDFSAYSGLLVTLNLNRVNSFVLLTAKYEDLKKIAKNFLDDAIFKQLAEFIYKLNENKVVDIFDDVDLKERQTKRGSELTEDNSDTDVSLSSENMKYIPINVKSNIKTRFEAKSKKITADDTNEAENERIKSIRDNKYLKDDILKTDNIERDDSRMYTEKTKKIKTKGRTKSDRTFRISTVTSARERNEFDQYDNFKYKKLWTSNPIPLKTMDFLRSRYIQK